jgi:hypothetical protein
MMGDNLGDIFNEFFPIGHKDIKCTFCGRTLQIDVQKRNDKWVVQMFCDCDEWQMMETAVNVGMLPVKEKL